MKINIQKGLKIKANLLKKIKLLENISTVARVGSAYVGTARVATKEV